MNDEFETTLANLKKAQGLVSDVQIAADKLPPSQASDDLRDAIEAAIDELNWAAHYIGDVAKEQVQP